MSYLVLARKYRPPNFEAMVGQAHVVQALANALTQQRLHHAYLFTGTRGVGKTTVARILAKSLNCTGADGQGGITAHACGVCEACRAIDGGRFVDYVELDAASNRGVEEITQLLDQAVYKPVLGRFKVYMIDEVHMLSNHAFNAMLKTLEEPPDYLKFVLATTDPQKVPPTVLSRCLQFNLRPMAAETVQDHLAEVLEKEGIAAEPGALRLLARAARGSMRDALSLTDQAIAFGAGHLAEAGIRQMLGAVDRGHAVRLLDALAAADGPALLGAANGLRELGLSAVGTLEEMADLLQQIAVLQAVPTAAVGDDAEQAQRLAALIGADEVALMYSMCLHGRAEIGLAPDEHGGLVMVLLRMLAFRPKDRTDSAAAATGSARPALPLQARQVASAKVAPAPAGAPRPRPAAVQRPAPPVPDVAPAPPAAGHADPVIGRDAQADAMPPWLDAPEQDADALTTPIAPRRGAATEAAAQSLAPGLPAAVGAGRAPADAGLPLRPTVLGDRWADAVTALSDRGSISAMVRELAWQAECIAIEEPGSVGGPAVWRLRVERETLRVAGAVERLQAALAEWLQRPLRLETESGPTRDTPALRASAERVRLQRAAEELIAADPLVQSLLSEFKTARIVPGSVRPC